MITCSKRRVKPLPGRAQGTATRPKPCCAHRTRGTLAVIKQWCWKKLRCRQVVFFEIMSLAKCTALRTRVKRSSFSLDIKTQLTRRLLKVQRLTNDFPGGGQSKAQCQQIICVHKLRLDQILM